LLGEEIKRKADEVAATRARYEELKKRYVELRQSPSPPGASTAPAPAKK
jgi:hypothetical protein